MAQELVKAIVSMNEAAALRLTGELLEAGADPLDILEDCREAMTIVGQQFEEGQAFISELIHAGDMLMAISETVKPRMKDGAEGVEKLGKVVFGTVEGDIHDIAKDIVVFMLDINGFEVIDLGVDVPPTGFVDAVREADATVVGLSGFLTIAHDPMKRTIEALRDADLNGVRVMIGGGQIDEYVQEYTGADAWGRDAMAAVALAKKWLGA